MKNLALPTLPADSPRPGEHFTNNDAAMSALVDQLRAIVLERMTPPGLVPDPVTLYSIEEHLADALVWVDVVLANQAEDGALVQDEAGDWVRAQ